MTGDSYSYDSDAPTSGMPTLFWLANDRSQNDLLGGGGMSGDMIYPHYRCDQLQSDTEQGTCGRRTGYIDCNRLRLRSTYRGPLPYICTLFSVMLHTMYHNEENILLHEWQSRVRRTCGQRMKLECLCFIAARCPWPWRTSRISHCPSQGRKTWPSSTPPPTRRPWSKLAPVGKPMHHRVGSHLSWNTSRGVLITCTL